MHKVYSNSAPPNIIRMFTVSNLNVPRREPQFFAVTFNRLWNLDKSISYIDTKLKLGGAHHIRHLAAKF